MRRANGTGTVVKLTGERRRPYMVKIPYRDKYGRVKQKPLSYHAKAAEAQAALDEYNANKAQGIAPPPDKLGITVEQVYALWSERKYAKAGASLQNSYKAAWNHLRPIANKKIRDVTIDHLQAIIDEREDAGASKSTISNVKMMMSAIYSYAMMRDIIGKDYSAYVELPTVGAKHKKGAFSETQVKKLEKMAADGFPWADTALILCYTGFRISELLELTPFNYDAKAQTLTGGMKTKAGKNRVVPIHPVILPIIIRRLEQRGDYIICESSGARVPWNKYRAYFSTIAEGLGMPEATPHWCRHTFATRLHAAGADELATKRLLGHANKDVTEGYTHTDLEQLKAAILLLA